MYSEQGKINSLEPWSAPKNSGHRLLSRVFFFKGGRGAEWTLRVVIARNKMAGYNGYKGRLEVAAICALYLVGQGYLAFIREKSGDFGNWSLWQPEIWTWERNEWLNQHWVTVFFCGGVQIAPRFYQTNLRDELFTYLNSPSTALHVSFS